LFPRRGKFADVAIRENLMRDTSSRRRFLAECAICQGQGRLAVRLHVAGRSLDAIRAAVDAKFG
jgi:hypothetical protein